MGYECDLLLYSILKRRCIMPSPTKTIYAKSPSPPNEKASVKNSTPTSKSASPDEKPKSAAPEANSRNDSSDPKPRTEPSTSKSSIKSPTDAKISGVEFDVANVEEPQEDPFYSTEPSDESGKMNTAVLVRPDTVDVATDTNDDTSDTDDECDTIVSRHSRRNSRNAYHSESRYVRCESAGNPCSDSRRSLNHYGCCYLQPSLSFTRFEGLSRQTERYSDVIRPFRYCGYSAKPDYCCRRL